MWTENPKKLPREYADYLACQLYHCTPSQLDQEDAEVVTLHLRFASVESKVKARHAEARAKKAKAHKNRKGQG